MQICPPYLLSIIYNLASVMPSYNNNLKGDVIHCSVCIYVNSRAGIMSGFPFMDHSLSPVDTYLMIVA